VWVGLELELVEGRKKGGSMWKRADGSFEMAIQVWKEGIKWNADHRGGC
jgi:hypothetical protein